MLWVPYLGLCLCATFHLVRMLYHLRSSLPPCPVSGSDNLRLPDPLFCPIFLIQSTIACFCNTADGDCVWPRLLSGPNFPYCLQDKVAHSPGERSSLSGHALPSGVCSMLLPHSTAALSWKECKFSPTLSFPLLLSAAGDTHDLLIPSASGLEPPPL